MAHPQVMHPMTNELPYLDVNALSQALDAERVARELTWADVARQAHYSVASIRGMCKRTHIDADAMVLLLQWLRRRCEDFVIRPNGPRSRRIKQAPVPPLFARVDTIALHAALDRERTRRGLTWDDVAEALGITTGVINRFRKGGRTTANLMIAAADWAGESVEALLQPSSAVLGPARMDAKARKQGCS
jgi:cyanate lyase